MEEDINKLDELFRDALKDFKVEPPAKAWDNIEGSLPVKPMGKGIFTRYINTAAVIVVVSTIIFTAYYFYNKNNRSQKSEVTSQKSINSNQPPASSLQQPTDNSKSAVSSQQSANKAVKTSKQEKLNNKTPLIADNKALKPAVTYSNVQSPASSLQLPASDIQLPASSLQPPASDIQLPASGIQPPASDIQLPASSLQPPASDIQLPASNLQLPASSLQLPASSLQPPVSDIQLPASDIQLPASDLKLKKIKPLFAKHISSNINESSPELAVPLSGIYPHRIFNPDYYIGINYTPEYFISHSDLLSGKADFAHSADLSLTLVWKQFTLRTGAGISFYNTDKFNYTVNYEKNEEIGTYSSVDSVSFTIINNKIVPTFYTSQVTVYDKVNQVYKSQINKKYAYLQIPLILGYRLNDMNRLSIYMNAGPVLSLTMYKKAGEIVYPENAVQIIDVQSNDVSRVSTYWDILVSLGLNYRLTGRLSINVEPQYRTSLGTVYSSSNPQLKKPYSVGLRSGIMFKL